MTLAQTCRVKQEKEKVMSGETQENKIQTSVNFISTAMMYSIHLQEWKSTRKFTAAST